MAQMQVVGMVVVMEVAVIKKYCDQSLIINRSFRQANKISPAAQGRKAQQPSGIAPYEVVLKVLYKIKY